MDVTFTLKIENFCTPCPPRPLKMSKFVKILDLENFRSILPLTLRVSGANTPSEPNESAIVNRQCGGEKLKYVPKFCIGGTGHVISRMPSDNLHWTGALELNVSKMLGDRGSVTMEHQ